MTVHSHDPDEPAPSGEFGLISWIRDHAPRTPAAARHVLLGIDDDCAALLFTQGRAVIATTDMLMDGRHFRTEEHPLEAIGFKALGVNLSDIAAMAATPIAALVAVALPRSLDSISGTRTAQRLHQGIVRQAECFDVALVGGDTNAWHGPLVVCITVLGEATERGIVTRAGAKPGDVLFVTGPLGGSLIERHLQPAPRVFEAIAIHQQVEIHAMIDISDGLAADLNHILESSGGLGAILYADSIPIAVDAERQSLRDGRTPLEHALRDGEDFELCFAVSPDQAAELQSQPPQGVTLFRIGIVTPNAGLWLARADGKETPIEPGGFDHMIM